MAAAGLKINFDLTRLVPGFHRQRFQARGVGFDAFIWRGGPGPILLLNGATHGDEYEGPTLLREWAARWRPLTLAGTVVMVPVLNESAFFAGQRCDPRDDVNLARVFPGRAQGTPTARLSHLFDTQLLAQCTHYADLHSGGLAYELSTWVGYMTRNDRVGRQQRSMAACFDGFAGWAGPYLPGRTLSAAFVRNIPAIYVECRGAGGIVPNDLRRLERGLRNLLHWAGITDGTRPRLRRQKLRVTRNAKETHLQIHHPAPHDGIFVPRVSLGQSVRRGEEIGIVLSLDGTKSSRIPAERAGSVVLLRYQRSVRRTDALCTLAPF